MTIWVIPPGDFVIFEFGARSWEYWLERHVAFRKIFELFVSEVQEKVKN